MKRIVSMLLTAALLIGMLSFAGTAYAAAPGKVTGVKSSVLVYDYAEKADFKVTWSAVEGATGYQINIGNYSFENGEREYPVVRWLRDKTACTVSMEYGLGEMYYQFAKVRAYKKYSDGTVEFGKWSKIADASEKYYSKPAKVTSLKATTDGKAKQIKLTWKKVPYVSGYLIKRSTTGKKGSYKTLKKVTGTSYTDKKLKSSKVYYYSVKPYKKKDGKTVYGAYKTVNLSTKISAAFVAKRFNTVYKAMAEIADSVDTAHPDSSYDRDENGWTYHRYPVHFRDYTMIEEFNEYLSKYFTADATEAITEAFSKKGNTIYIALPAEIAEAENEKLLPDDVYADTLKAKDKKATFTLHLPFLLEGLPEPYYTINVKTQLVYSGGKWRFAFNAFWTDNLFKYSE